MFLYDALHVLAHLLSKYTRVEVEDALNDCTLCQELLHGVPGGVLIAENAQHTLHDIVNRLRRHLQGTQPVQIRFGDALHCLTCLVDDGLHVLKLFLYFNFGALDLAFFRGQELL